MSKKKKEEKIAVVIDGMDICRIVPFKPVDGKYEMKIDFLSNEFDTKCYRLFSHRPIHWGVDNSKQSEITYHKGENNKPLTIHIKNKEKIEGVPTYTNLPLKRIQAPSVNQLFPIPLLKLEIPSKASQKKYKPKSYHKMIQPEDCNVVEIYMAHKDFDMDSFANKLPGMHLAFLTLSFEIFATNTVVTDYHKSMNIIPEDEPKSIMTGFDILSDMKIFAIHFKDKHIDERLSKINVTFIENEFSEAIFGMLKIAYPKPSIDGTYQHLYLGGASLNDVSQPVGPLSRPSIGNYNVMKDSLNRSKLSNEEKEKLYWHALKLRIKLRDALIEHEKHRSELRDMLEKRISEFINAINRVKVRIRELNLSEDEKEWFDSYPNNKSFYISLMIGKYLGMDECIMYGRYILDKKNKKEVFHAWLLYHDLFDIDVAYTSLSKYTTLELENIIIVPPEQHPLLSEYGSMRHTISDKGYTRGELRQGVYNIEKMNSYFNANERLLLRVYDVVLDAIENKNKGR
ncbi:MAG: hypothetical protein PWR27_2281 [Petroclostridium sp.]|jgi:hypothetical protein|nr:hypothetical protein [Petroclostridium sp.]